MSCNILRAKSPDAERNEQAVRHSHPGPKRGSSAPDREGAPCPCPPPPCAAVPRVLGLENEAVTAKARGPASVHSRPGFLRVKEGCVLRSTHPGTFQSACCTRADWPRGLVITEGKGFHSLLSPDVGSFSYLYKV